MSSYIFLHLWVRCIVITGVRKRLKLQTARSVTCRKLCRHLNRPNGVTEEATKSCNLSSYSYLPEYASIIEIELTAISKDEESDTPEVAAH
jgi:hypothetical protein